MYQKIQKLIPLIIVIICIPAAWHLLYPGYFSVHDDMHPAWILEMYRAIQSGQFPPRYAPDLSYGFGYPLFHFIYPLPYYIGAAYYSLGLNLIWSIKLIYILSLPFSALAMYVFTRRHLSTLGAIICSVIYIYTPYRAVNIYVRGALGESLSFVFIPIIFWSIDKAFEIPNKRTISFAGLSFAGLILTHNIAAYIVAPFALIYFVFRFYSHNNLNAIFNLFKMLILGLALSAYFWIPAIIDKRLMIENPIFNYRDHFPFIKQLLFSKWGYGASLWGPDDGFSFQLGIINLISIFLLGLLTLITFYRDKKIIFSSFFTLSSTLFLLYLMNIRSSWIWDTIPFMNYFQFPWRLLLLITFFSSFAAGQIYDQITKHKPNLKVYLLIILGLFSMGTVRYFQPDKHINISTEDIITKYFAVDPNNPQPPISSQYSNIKEEYLRLPKGTSKRPDFYPFLRVKSANDETKISYLQTSPTSYQFITNGPATELSVFVYAFPLWQVYIDKKVSKYYSGEPYGQLSINIDDGYHKIDLMIKEIGWRRSITIISISSIVVAMFLIILPNKNVKK